MKYLCQIYLDEPHMGTLSVAETEALNREHHTFDDSLVQSGNMLATGALSASSASTCVRVRDGRVAITDGPYAETKEQVAGFFLVEARDLDEALRIAARIPSARIGAVEVRPLRPLVIAGKEYWCMDRLTSPAAR